MCVEGEEDGVMLFAPSLNLKTPWQHSATDRLHNVNNPNECS